MGLTYFFKKTVPFVLYVHYVSNLMDSKLCPSKSASDHTMFISNNYLMVRAMRLGARSYGKPWALAHIEVSLETDAT